MELTQLLTTQNTPKAINDGSSPANEETDERKKAFLEELSKFLIADTIGQGEILANNLGLSLPNGNLFNFNAPKLPNDELESFITILNNSQFVFQDQLNNIADELNANNLVTTPESIITFSNQDLSEILVSLSNFLKDNPSFLENNLINQKHVINHEVLQKIASDLEFLNYGEVISGDRTQETLGEIKEIINSLLAKRETVSNNPENQTHKLTENAPKLTLTENNSVETSKPTQAPVELAKNSVAMEGTSLEAQKNHSETNSNSFNQSLFSQDSPSGHFVIGNQSLSKFTEDAGISHTVKDPEISPKELPEFILKQINNNLKFNKLTGTSELSLRLKPEELGKITLQLLAQDGQVTVKIITDNIRAREIVEQNLGQLKQTLANQGIKCSGIDVQVNTDSSFNQFMGHQQNPFNQTKYYKKGKYSLDSYNEKKLQIEEFENNISPSSSPKHILDGLELFA